MTGGYGGGNPEGIPRGNFLEYDHEGGSDGEQEKGVKGRHGGLETFF